ncbi:MAG: hypothetical protein OEZ41_00545, partial [Nitrospirota bacterium]|nr:hypothetical protein [Nitrospirota bacterium]
MSFGFVIIFLEWELSFAISAGLLTQKACKPYFFGKEPPSKLGGIQDLEIQFELFGIMLMLDISTNH